MNGIIYDSTGVYIDTLINSNGCDSVVTIDLTINYSSSQFLNITACGYYLWDSIIMIPLEFILIHL